MECQPRDHERAQHGWIGSRGLGRVDWVACSADDGVCSAADGQVALIYTYLRQASRDANELVFSSLDQGQSYFTQRSGDRNKLELSMLVS